MTALNIAYEEKEKRSLGHFYGIAFTITVAAVVLVLIGLAAIATVQSLDRLLPRVPGPVVELGRVGLYALLGLIAAGVAATLYRYGPAREDARWEWLTPGSVFTAVIWLALTAGFGFYVTRLADYNATYGSIAAIVVLHDRPARTSRRAGRVGSGPCCRADRRWHDGRTQPRRGRPAEPGGRTG
jgi:membrane protein